MINRRIASVLSLLLAVLLLAGCGSSTTTEKPQASSAPAQVSEEASEGFAYRASFTPVQVEKKDYLTPCAFTEAGYYGTTYEAIGEQIPEGVTPEYEGQYTVYASSIFFIGYDGSCRKLESYVPLQAPEAEEGQYNYTTSVYLEAVYPREDGSLVVLENVFMNWCKKPGLTWEDDSYWNNYAYQQLHYLRLLNADGSEIRSVLLPLGEDEYSSGSCMLESGELAMVFDASLRAYSLEGEQLWEIPLEGNYISQLIRASDGTLYAYSWADDGQVLLPIDVQNHAFGEAVSAPANSYVIYSGGGDFPLYYSTGSWLCGFDPATGTTEQIFSWLNTDIGTDVSSFYAASDGTYYGQVSDYEQSETGEYLFSAEIYSVRKLPVSELSKKETVTLAGYGINYEVARQIVKFNRSQDDVHIEVTDYSEGAMNDLSRSEGEGTEAPGLTRLKADLAAGKAPDLLFLEGLNAGTLAKQGLLEDLYPLIDADKQLGRESFFANVLAECERDGKLVCIPLSYYIATLRGAKAVVGDEPGWTYDELEAALSTMPEGCTALSKSTTRADILSICLNLEGKNLIDREAGTCNLNSEAYVKLLAFAKSFPDSFDWETYDYTTDSDAMRIAAGEQMLESYWMSGVSDILYSSSAFEGIPVTYIGYPTSDGSSGSYFNFNTCFAITSTCKNKDNAWAFLRTLLTEKGQKSLYGIQINRAAFEATLSDIMKVEYRKNSSGEYVLDENGEKIPEAKMSYMGEDGKVHNVYALSEEEASALRQLVENTHCVFTEEDEELKKIISSEAEAYFAGQKSAEEVARLTQSKASIYLSEKS